MGLLFTAIVFLLGTTAIIYATIRVAINEEAFFVFMAKKASTVVGGVFLLYTVMSVLLSGILDNSHSGKSEIVFIGKTPIEFGEDIGEGKWSF